VAGTSTRGILNVNFFITNFSAVDHRADIKTDK